MARQRKTAPATQQITTGTVLRFEQPSSNRKKKPGIAEVVIQEANPVSGFSGFLKDYAVVGLAIGFIVGIQAQELVKSLVTSFIDPAFKLLFRDRLQDRVFHLSFSGRQEVFYWGTFARAVMYFLFVLAAIYILVKVLKLDKFGKKDDNTKK